MKIKLRSKFSDYYDRAFCGSREKPDVVFDRNSACRVSSQTIFDTLTSAGFQTPDHGRVRDLIPSLRVVSADLPAALTDELHVVVHLDEHAHTKNGEMLLRFSDAEKWYPDAFAVEYLPTVANGGSVSYRHLRVGRRMFWLRYTSRDDWRANCGDTQVEFLCDAGPVLWPDVPIFRQYPIVAVDFLRIGNRMLAISMDTTPVIRNTGVDRILKPRDVVDALSDWFSNTAPF